MTEKFWTSIDELPLIMDVNDLRKILRMSKPTVYSLMDDPAMNSFRLGRCKRVTRDAFFAWLNNQSNK